jgi:elongation factor Ts
MTHIEKVKHIREVTMASMGKINKALTEANGDVDKAIEILVKQRETSVEDMANRKADSSFVYSYVHNNKVGAMVVMASQTDFVAKNDLFTQLAKDICMHIVSNPIQAEGIDVNDVGIDFEKMWESKFREEVKGKPEQIVEKIVAGKLAKKLDDVYLLRQKFIKDDSITINELIMKVSGMVGEKIEIKRFVRLSA